MYHESVGDGGREGGGCVPTGTLQAALDSIFSIPKSTSWAIRIPRVMASW